MLRLIVAPVRFAWTGIKIVFFFLALLPLAVVGLAIIAVLVAMGSAA